MAMLTHEIWVGPDGLPGLCLSDPDGDGFRALQEPGSVLVGTFEAGSHLEAMSKYHAFLGRGDYRSDFNEDAAPYPDEWLEVQRGPA